MLLVETVKRRHQSGVGYALVEKKVNVAHAHLAALPRFFHQLPLKFSERFCDGLARAQVTTQRESWAFHAGEFSHSPVGKSKSQKEKGKSAGTPCRRELKIQNQRAKRCLHFCLLQLAFLLLTCLLRFAFGALSSYHNGLQPPPDSSP